MSTCKKIHSQHSGIILMSWFLNYLFLGGKWTRFGCKSLPQHCEKMSGNDVYIRYIGMIQSKHNEGTNIRFSIKACPTTASLDKMCQCFSMHCLICLDAGEKVVTHTILFDRLDIGALGVTVIIHVCPNLLLCVEFHLKYPCCNLLWCFVNSRGSLWQQQHLGR